MNRFAPCAAAAVLCCAGAPSALADFIVNANGTARYQGAPLQTGSQTVVNPGGGLGDVVNISLLSDPANDGFSFAASDSRFGLDALGGTAKNFARASGYDPNFGPPDEVFATSNVSATLEYRVTSATTPVGTPIQIRTVLSYSGQLGVANYFGTTNPGELTATFASSFTIDGVSYFDASATFEQQFSNFAAPAVLTTTGPWGGAWAFSTETVFGLGDYRAATLSYSDIVIFDTVMAADFDVVFTQSATANIPAPYEGFAAGDFTNTGEFTLRAFDASGVEIPDAVFTVIPAPATALLALAVPAIAACRRRD